LVEESGVVMQTDNENKKLEEARNIIIDALGRVYALYGLPDVIGRIYGVLFLADRPLGLEDIAQMLGVSKSTVSINIRILEGVGMFGRFGLRGVAGITMKQSVIFQKLRQKPFRKTMNGRSKLS